MIVLSDFSYDFGLLLLIVIYRPQKLPLHFSVTFDLNDGESEVKHINIFLSKIKSENFYRNDSLVLNNLSDSDKKEVIRDLEIPIAVLNPCEGEFKGKIIFF